MSTRVLFLLGCFAVAQTACSRRTLPARGELLVLISSDMQVPDSFNALVITLASETAGTRHVYVPNNNEKAQWLDLSESSNALGNDCVPQSADELAVGLTLPTTLGLQSKSKDATHTQLTVTACKAGTKLFSTSLAVTLPSEGEVALQRLPIRWLCAEKGTGFVVGCYGCDGTRCYGQNVRAKEGDTSACAVGACQTPQDAYPTAPYDADESKRYRAGSSDKSGCFDVLGCFSTRHLVTPAGSASYPVAVDWRKRPAPGATGSSLQCIARVDSSDHVLSRLNLALLLPPGTQGTCTEAHCLVALEANSPLGYRVDPDHAEDLLLPNAICNMLDSGQVLSVLATYDCAPRSADTPVCGTGTQESDIDTGAATYEEELKHATVLHYGFEESEQSTAVFIDDVSQLDLVFVDPATAANNTARIDGVTAQGFARSFDSQHYAKSQVQFAPPEGSTLVTWVALPEPAFAKTATPTPQFDYGPRFPLLSNLGADCKTGFHVELERCTDERRVQVAFARPTDRLENGECQLKWHYATLAESGWSGGYFSPFKRGDFRQLAISYERGKSPTIYVDGDLVGLADKSCGTDAATATATASDDSFLYLGSSAVLAQASQARTAPIELDEVSLYDRLLSPTEIRWLSTSTTTVIGPGGLPWGAWATQGGSASVKAATLQRITAALDDRTFSSAGLFALLGPETTPGVFSRNEQADLSKYDEAVLWLELPPETPFQFALSADHGRRQCTWQLRSGKTPYYVINLQQPSWCVDPNCGFALTNVERVSVAYDWKLSSGNTDDFSVSALAFRRRLLTNLDVSPGGPTRVGGLPETPDGWCWRAVSYDPQWLARLSTAQAMSLEVLRKPSNLDSPPELAADLPPRSESRGSRDFSQCSTIRVLTNEAVGPGVFSFVLTNEQGQTVAWPLSPTGNISSSYSAALDVDGQGWPAGNEATKTFPAPTSTAAVRDHAVRMALRFPGDLRVKSVQCCDLNESCKSIDAEVPAATPR